MKITKLKVLFVLAMMSVLAATFLRPQLTAASEPVVLASADYTFVYPQLPDTNVWSVSTQGNIVQVPVAGMGLAMADPDNISSLMYTYPTPLLSGDPNNPNYQNTDTFRVKARIPYVSNGSLQWYDHYIGWRMIVDDGLHRIELVLARNPAFAREVWIRDCPSFAPLSFPWDNELENNYEIKRLSDGNYLITLYNEDPLIPPVSRLVLAGQLPPSGGTPLFAWGMASRGGGAVYWQEVHVDVFAPAAANQPPSIDSINAAQEPAPVNTAVSASAAFSDPDVGDTHTAVWDWGDGTTSPGTVSELNGSGTVNDTHTYAAAGVYPVTLTVADDDGESASAVFEYIVVYDPNGGFVTGGGWIDSPAGAYTADPSLAGKANFGFVSRYQPGNTLPGGSTEFQFKAGGLTFRSTVYDWLVVAGSKAQFKGEGTLNGTGNYGFLLTATDGQLNGGGGVDKFRIKIWDQAAGLIVYDNQMGADDNAALVTALGGGAIVIHR